MSQDIRPDIKSIRFFEDDDHRYRIFLTTGGMIACEKFDARTRKWKHVPLREATEQEMNEMLAVRYKSEDEEIARTVASYKP